jgi:type IV pilus assembly protein PilC
MPLFAYTAIEARSGRTRRGELESSSPEQAVADLKSRGLAPTALKLAGASAIPGSRTSRSAKSPGLRTKPGWTIGRVIGPKALARFTRQMATLDKAGMPLLRSLEVLARQERNPAFRAVLENLAATIRSGGSLSDGLRQHPRIFDRLYVNMVRAGEAGGVVGEVLARVAGFMEKGERIKGRIKAAMTYPIIVVLLAGAIVSGLMVFVVPKFEQIFASMLKGQPLPALTRFVLGASNLVKDHAWEAAGLMTLGVIAFVLLRKTRAGTRGGDWLLIKAPVMGDLFLKAAIGRFTRTFGTLLSSGVPMLSALVITRDTSGNAHVAGAIDVVHDRVKAGDNVARPLAATGIFPGLVTGMIEVGEETGALPDMLTRIADTYDEEVDNAVTALTSLIEPLMIMFMALMVGTIVLALFLPIVSLIQHLQ